MTQLMENILKDIYQLKREFDELNPSDNFAFIQFYENNIDSIDNIDVNKDENHYDAKLRLFCEYGLSLVGQGLLSKGISVLSQAIPMFENAPNQDQTKLIEISYYEHLLWNYAIGLNRAKHFEDSRIAFERLVECYPNNGKYKVWLKDVKAQKLGKLLKPLWGVCLVWLIGEYTFFEKLDSNTRFYLATIGAVTLVFTLMLEGWIYIIKMEKARKHNKS